MRICLLIDSGLYQNLYRTRAMLFYLLKWRKKKQALKAALNAMCIMFVHETCVSMYMIVFHRMAGQSSFWMFWVFFYFMPVKHCHRSDTVLVVLVWERQLYIRWRCISYNYFLTIKCLSTGGYIWMNQFIIDVVYFNSHVTSELITIIYWHFLA